MASIIDAVKWMKVNENSSLYKQDCFIMGRDSILNKKNRESVVITPEMILSNDWSLVGYKKEMGIPKQVGESGMYIMKKPKNKTVKTN